MDPWPVSRMAARALDPTMSRAAESSLGGPQFSRSAALAICAVYRGRYMGLVDKFGDLSLTVGFGPLAFEALRRHFGTLKTVKWIGYAGSVTNDMAREVLEGCPLLEEFHSPFLWVDDFVGSQGRIDQAGEEQGQRETKDSGVDQEQRTHSYFSTATTGQLPSPPLSPTPAPALIPDQQQQQPQQQQQEQLPLKPWPCEGLKSLFISATSPNFFAPPLSKSEEEIIRTRLATMKELTYYSVGSTIFSTTFRHEY
ncbi:hypothetical protein BGZ88_012264 [Linnemannia elongata]|nr:hypothetical protein BGZ88_012264 [Linnemannia elongata]